MRPTLRFVNFALALLVLMAATASAQTKGRVAVGASVTTIVPTQDDVHGTTGVGFQVRLAPRKGWGPAGALNWFQADIDGTVIGVSSRIGRIRVRPVMAGVGYTWISGPSAFSASVVAGPSWNRLQQSSTSAAAAQTSTDTALAVRPGVSFTYAVQPRLALTTFAGYLINRPRLTVRSSAGDVSRTWKTDAMALSVGVVYSFF